LGWNRRGPGGSKTAEAAIEQAVVEAVAHQHLADGIGPMRVVALRVGVVELVMKIVHGEFFRSACFAKRRMLMGVCVSGLFHDT